MPNLDEVDYEMKQRGLEQMQSDKPWHYEIQKPKLTKKKKLNDYEQFKIKRYAFWDLYLHKNQFPYIGRCYASAIRDNADLVTDMNLRESEELFSLIVPSWHSAVSELFGKFRPNIAILGNEWPHLHAHLIPRFQDNKHFYGIDFIDPNPKANYSPYPKKEISLEVLLKIKKDIENKI